MFTVLVCGGRHYSDECKVSKTLLDLCDKKGLWDTGHQHWAESLAVGLRIVTGEARGNEKVDLVIAFPGGSGTADMVRRARKAKIPVQEVKG